MSPGFSTWPTVRLALDKRGEVGPLGVVHRRRHRDDIEIAAAQALDIGRVAQLLRGGEFRVGHFVGAIDAAGQLLDAAGVDVEADHGKMPRQIDGERKAHIAETNDANPNVGEGRQFHPYSPNDCKLRFSHLRRGRCLAANPARALRC